MVFDDIRCAIYVWCSCQKKYRRCSRCFFCIANKEHPEFCSPKDIVQCKGTLQSPWIHWLGHGECPKLSWVNWKVRGLYPLATAWLFIPTKLGDSWSKCWKIFHVWHVICFLLRFSNTKVINIDVSKNSNTPLSHWFLHLNIFIPEALLGVTGCHSALV